MSSINSVKEGDLVEVKTSKSELSGMIISSPNPKIISLKLDSGYNVGIPKNGIKKIKKISSKKHKIDPPRLKMKKSKLPQISIITTGGTITSRVDYRTGAVYALSKPEELLASIPEVSDIANLRILNPFSMMSEDMGVKEWQTLAQETAKELNKKEVKGVIITHGTDTLHFTAAILSFMLKDLNKPIALVGGQRSSDRGSFDGAQNLICATHYCLSDIAEVAIVMHGSTEDYYCIANLGTKVRKFHTSRRDAFRPINILPIAKIWPNGKIKVNSKKYRKRSKGKVVADTKFESKVALLKFAPNMDPSVIDFYIKSGYKGIILEGTGLGHVAVQSKKSWLPAIKKAINKGIFVGMTSQCEYGRVDPYVYTNMRLLMGAGVTYLEDILPETAYVKLGWVLGQTKKLDKVKELMLENIAGEINKRIPSKAFLY
ncbi:MAG: Glu-tRNA(Gln) amidotransferase subunit GatD [Candidatus Woesearchaeota archaeon]|nr:MAG: Glu-tRNA(Gln) amidotransferase subunit GatD [Candidatus Woesearchaeota archaeon]